VILPEFVREVSEAFYAIDHRDLYNVMLDVTMVVMHRCHLSYEQVDALDEMVAPLKHALGFPAGRRLLASSKQLKPVIAEFAAEWPTVHLNAEYEDSDTGLMKTRVASALSIVQIVEWMWSTPLMQILMCPDIFTESGLFWTVSLDARVRGKIHETILTIFLRNAVFSVLSFTNVFTIMIMEGKEEAAGARDIYTTVFDQV
jgi:hypothetical protein